MDLGGVILFARRRKVVVGKRSLCPRPHSPFFFRGSRRFALPFAACAHAFRCPLLPIPTHAHALQHAPMPVDARVTVVEGEREEKRRARSSFGAPAAAVPGSCLFARARGRARATGLFSSLLGRPTGQAGRRHAGGASRPLPGTRIGLLASLALCSLASPSCPLFPGTTTADPAPADVSDAKRARAAEPPLPSTSATPTPVDYAALFSEEGARRRLAGLREIVAAAAGRPGVVGLHGGFPPPDAFPFVRLTATLKDGTTVEVSDPGQVRKRWEGGRERRDGEKGCADDAVGAHTREKARSVRGRARALPLFDTPGRGL